MSMAALLLSLKAEPSFNVTLFTWAGVSPLLVILSVIGVEPLDLKSDSNIESKVTGSGSMESIAGVGSWGRITFKENVSPAKLSFVAL